MSLSVAENAQIGLNPDQTEAQQEQGMQVGDIIDVFVKPDNVWYKGTILRITDHGPFIHYHGLDESRDEYFLRQPAGMRIIAFNSEINKYQQLVQEHGDVLSWISVTNQVVSNGME